MPLKKDRAKKIYEFRVFVGFLDHNSTFLNLKMQMANKMYI